jgi:hypothetical protein
MQVIEKALLAFIQGGRAIATLPSYCLPARVFIRYLRNYKKEVKSVLEVVYV